MGTTWRVLYAATAARTDMVRAEIERRLVGLLGQLSHWNPASALCRYNRAPAGTQVLLADDLARVVDAGLRVAQASGGTFDPAIGALVDLWGHGPPGPRRVPTDDEIHAALAQSSFWRMRWDAPRALLLQPGGVALDLSGIAKGYAVDRIADLLGALGLRHCLVEIGGELAGRGLRPDGEPWWVDLELPPGIDLPPLRVALHQLGVATSGTYRRGEHSLDPRTGRPAVAGVVAASVIAADAMTADALATVASVSGGVELLDQLDVAARLVVSTPAGLREYLTRNLVKMLDDVGRDRTRADVVCETVAGKLER
jgi:thiamine biosynthesis lipoprotein